MRLAPRARLVAPFARLATLAPLIALALLPARGQAQSGERLDLTAAFARGVDRFQSLGADTLGLTYGRSYQGEVGVDFRVLDFPAGKSPRPIALHFTARGFTDERTLAPALPGQLVGRYAVLGFGGGAYVELPFELLKGNAGVSLRLGWDGSELLTRTRGNDLLDRSMMELGFVRTTGVLRGSSIGVAHGRDETFGYDSTASKRWDVRLSLQGRLVRLPGGIAAPAPKPGAKSSPRPSPSDERLIWAFVDVDVNTGIAGAASGLYGRAGIALDLGGLVGGAIFGGGR